SRQLHHPRHRHTLKTSVCGGFFCALSVLWCPKNRTEIAPISHRSVFPHNAQLWFGLLIVIPDELAVGSKNHLHIFMAQLAGHVPGVSTSSEKCRGIRVPDLVGVA